MSMEQVDQLDKRLEGLKASVGFSPNVTESRKSPVKEDRLRPSSSRRSLNGIKENEQKSPRKEQTTPTTRSSPKSSKPQSHQKDVGKASNTEAAETSRRSSSRQKEENKSNETGTNDLKHLLSSISISDEQPEKSLKAIESILGSENLLKLQNLLLKGIILNSISGSPSTSKSKQQAESEQKLTEQQSSDSQPESEGQIKEPPKKKKGLSELERLNAYNNEIYEGEDVLKVGQRMRACMLKTSEKITQCYERETGPLFPPQSARLPANRPAPASKKNKSLIDKFKLKKCTVNAVKLNVTKKDVPLLIQSSMKEEYINKNKSKLKVKLDESFDIDQVKIKEEPIIQETAIDDKSKLKPEVIRSVAKKRVRSQWSRGMIKKRKKEKQDSWTEVAKDKKKVQYVAGMNLGKFSKYMRIVGKMLERSKNITDVDAVSSALDMDVEEEAETVQKKAKLSLDDSSDPLVKMVESMETSGDEENLLEEIPSSPEENDENPFINIPEQPEKDSNNKPTVKEPSPAEPEPTPPSKVGLIKLIPQARLMQPVPPSINVSDNENIVSPTPKLVGLLASPTTAVIRPLQQTSTVPMKSFKILPQAPQLVIPNALQQLIRLDFTAKSGNAQIPQLTNVPIPKNLQPIRRLSIFTPQQGTTVLTKPSTSQPSSDDQIPVNIIAKSRVNMPIRRLSLAQTAVTKPQEQAAVFKQPSLPNPQTSNASTSKPVSNTSENVLPRTLPPKMFVNTSIDSSSDILRPWIDNSKCSKKRNACEKMINNYCLAALYKCMATSCTFFTNDKHLFQIHVELHVKLQPRDSSNSLLCSYCNNISSSILGLIKHIEHEHRFDMFR